MQQDIFYGQLSVHLPMMEVADVLKRGYLVLEGTAYDTRLHRLTRAHQSIPFCMAVVESQPLDCCVSAMDILVGVQHQVDRC